MQGRYRGAELRAHMRTEWERLVIPELVGHETAPLLSLLPDRQGIVAIDIGANKGWWAAAMFRSFPGRVGHIYMIDASPENFRELTNFHDHLTLTQDELRLVSAYPYGMSSQPGSITLYTNDDGSPVASVYPDVTLGWHHEEVKLSKAIKVPADTVDDFMDRQGLERVDVLKIDVEGYEMSVLEGAERALRRKGIDVVLFEFGIHQVQARNNFRDFWEFFKDRGYTLSVEEDGAIRRIPKYLFEFENLSRQYVMFATPG